MASLTLDMAGMQDGLRLCPVVGSSVLRLGLAAGLGGLGVLAELGCAAQDQAWCLVHSRCEVWLCCAILQVRRAPRASPGPGGLLSLPWGASNLLKLFFFLFLKLIILFLFQIGNRN